MVLQYIYRSFKARSDSFSGEEVRCNFEPEVSMDRQTSWHPSCPSHTCVCRTAPQSTQHTNGWLWQAFITECAGPVICLCADPLHSRTVVCHFCAKHILSESYASEKYRTAEIFVKLHKKSDIPELFHVHGYV